LKLLKKVRTIPTVAVVVSAVLVSLATGGCGDVSDPTTAPGGAAGVNTGGTASGSYTVTPGSSVRRTVTGSGKISFTVVGVDMGLEEDKQPIVHFYDSKGYGGGRTTGGFQGELRNYKLKYYGADGELCSESYYVEPKGNTPRWDGSTPRSVVLEWKTGNDGYVRSTVDGIPFEKPGPVSETFTLGIGYAPTVPGWVGAVYTNVVWPKGSKPL